MTFAVAVAVCAVSGVAGVDRDHAVSAGSAVAPARAAAFVAGRICLAGTTSADLGRLFDTEPGGLVGADYQRPMSLGDGRVLWLFQDGAVRIAPDRIVIVHNVAMLQDGNCFDVYYGGTRTDPRPFLFADATIQFRRWYWPLDGEVGADGRLYVFVAEMEELGDEYLSEVRPTATRLAVIDPATLSTTQRSAPNASTDLYGWSITSDDRWTYLYAQCYRQFGYDLYIFTSAFDRECSPIVTVARVPKGQLLTVPQYWDGRHWQPDPALAAPVVETAGRRINADQIEWNGARFLSVNKEGDWWGDTVYLSHAMTATGPFTVFAEVLEPVTCAECNGFFASWVPREAGSRPPSTLMYGLSHNRWDGIITASYRPTFHLVSAPPYLPAGTMLRVGAHDRAGAEAVVLNLTVTQPTTRGYLTAFPCDRERPVASNVNYVPDRATANLAIVRPDAGGGVCVVASADLDLVVDLAGSFAVGGGFEVVDRPVRIVDTRAGLGAPAGRVPAGRVLEVSVPDGSASGAVALNVTATDAVGRGYATAFACDVERPVASNVNFAAGASSANLVLVRADAAGRVCLFVSQDTHLVVDLAGSFAVGGGFEVVDRPVRIVDTRIGLGTPA